jgi:hypothetical protein
MTHEAILTAASQIFAGCVAAGKLTVNNTDQIANFSLQVAARMAQLIEQQNFAAPPEIEYPFDR